MAYRNECSHWVELVAMFILVSYRLVDVAAGRLGAEHVRLVESQFVFGRLSVAVGCGPGWCLVG
jgi:hypothetical protein